MIRTNKHLEETTARRRYGFSGLLSLTIFFMLVSSGYVQAQPEPFVGEVRMFAGNFAPQGWLFCDGSLLSIANYEVLYTLIGTTYGGDGQQTFALPDLRSRVPIGDGQGSGLSNYIIGQRGGVETVTLTVAQLPAHTHPVFASSLPGSTANPVTDFFAKYPGEVPAYSTGGDFVVNVGTGGNAGGGQPHNNLQPYLAVNYIISTAGIYPSQGVAPPKSSTSQGVLESEPFLGEIVLVAFDFDPKGWISCSGQVLPINQNQALFALLGTTYGGNGTTNFNLPDLRGRVPLDADGSSIPLGGAGGEETHTLLTSEMPAHSHSFPAVSSVGASAGPMNLVPAVSGEDSHNYATVQNGTLNPQMLAPVGGGQAHENRKPYLAMHYIIALQGIFPSQN